MTVQPASVSTAKLAFRWGGGYEPYILLVLCMVFWAGNIIVGRLAAGHVPPLTMNWIRWTGSFLLFLPFAWHHLRRDLPKLRGHWPLIIALGATGFAICNSCTYLGLQYTQALNALLMQSGSPLFVALWMLVLFRIRLTLAQAIGILVSLTGVLVIILRGDLSALAAVRFNIGDLIMVAGVAVFGLYSALMSRKPPKVHPIALTAVTMAIGAMCLTPVAAIELLSGHYALILDRVTVATLVYVAIFPSMLSYLLFNRGIELIGPNRAAPFMHLVPVLGSAMAIVFLGEQPQLYHLIGYVLVLAGVSVAARKPA